jgi:hypothetical protein
MLGVGKLYKTKKIEFFQTASLIHLILSAWISEKGKWVIVDLVRFGWNFQGLCILAFKNESAVRFSMKNSSSPEKILKVWKNAQNTPFSKICQKYFRKPILW